MTKRYDDLLAENKRLKQAVAVLIGEDSEKGMKKDPNLSRHVSRMSQTDNYSKIALDKGHHQSIDKSLKGKGYDIRNLVGDSKVYVHADGHKVDVSKSHAITNTKGGHDHVTSAIAKKPSLPSV